MRIAGLRGLGMPAGYVSGFLRNEQPPGQPWLEGADAIHAWVCAWCGKADWIDENPTKTCYVGTDHILGGIGRDYVDVAPVAGVLRLAGVRSSMQAIDVIPVGGADAPRAGQPPAR